MLPTGGGKTVVFARALAEHRGVAVAIAHRRELVRQIALALTREGTPYQIAAPRDTIRRIIRHVSEATGSCTYDPEARVTVASVDSLPRASDTWARSVSLAVIDEAHHVTRTNKWGRALARMPRARLLGVTATPTRADRAGLGAHADGVFTRIVCGPDMRSLISAGYLAPYHAYAPGHVDLSGVAVGRSGDYSSKQLRARMVRANITGDVVQHYVRHARGKRGVTFACSVQAAEDLAAAYRSAGVPAACVHAKTPASERDAAVAALASGEILQIANVDLFGEGFDLPAIDCVSMARPTKSFSLYSQQFGRALRVSPGKTHALIFDHVGNIAEHGGPPDLRNNWSLDRGEKRGKAEVSPYRTCVGCTYVYPRSERHCPDCGSAPSREQRSSPELVDGDLVLLDPDVLAALYERVARVDRPESDVVREARAKHMPEIGVGAARKRHRKLQDAQASLRAAMYAWAGAKKHEGAGDSEILRDFYAAFGVDMLTAKTLKPDQAVELERKINAKK